MHKRRELQQLHGPNSQGGQTDFVQLKKSSLQIQSVKDRTKCLFQILKTP